MIEKAPKITIRDFCIDLSHVDKRVELIAGFNHSEVVARRARDTRDNYKARYDAFLNKPV
jgi:hypothetical protein